MRKQQTNIIRILIFVFAVLIVLLGIFEVAYFLITKNKLKEIQLVPEFSETSLEVGTQYTFKINTTPSGASIKKATAVVDDPTSTFEIDGDKAVLTTGMSEGNVTVYVECKDLKSQVLTFSVVDSVARAQAEAAAQAEAQQKAEEEAAAAAEAEAAAVAKKYVKSTGDDVNVRSTNSTDGDVLGKAKKGEMFEKVEDVDDWTHIIYNGQDGYMKTEFLTEISEEEFQEGGTAEASEDEKKEDEKKDEKKQEENNENTENTTGATQTEEEAKKKAAEAKAAEEQAAAEAAAQAAAAAAAASAAQSTSLLGVSMTPQEYQYVLDQVKYATDNGTNEEARKYHEEHHTAADIKTLLIAGGYRTE